MRLNKDKLALVATLAICAGRTTNAESAADQLQPLVEISAQRLVIVEQAALAKWDSGAPVEYPSRDELIMLSQCFPRWRSVPSVKMTFFVMILSSPLAKARHPESPTRRNSGESCGAVR